MSLSTSIKVNQIIQSGALEQEVRKAIENACRDYVVLYLKELTDCSMTLHYAHQILAGEAAAKGYDLMMIAGLAQACQIYQAIC